MIQKMILVKFLYWDRIAAGTPIEAIQNEVSRVTIPEQLNKNGEHFGLKVSGDSMVEAGINDGDTVIVKKTRYS